MNEEDQMRIISMEKGGDVKGVFSRLARGIKAVGDSVKAECGKDFALSEQYGYIHSCPTNLGTGMRASVMIDLPGYTKEGLPALQKRCEELAVQPRGTRGESGGFDGECPSYNRGICLLFGYFGGWANQATSFWQCPDFGHA